VPALLAAEICARTGRDPGEHYQDLVRGIRRTHYACREAPADRRQKRRLAALKPEQWASPELGGEKVTAVISRAHGNSAPIGGIKVATADGWFTVRPSGTESIYKIYGRVSKARSNSAGFG